MSIIKKFFNKEEDAIDKVEWEKRLEELDSLENDVNSKYEEGQESLSNLKEEYKKSIYDNDLKSQGRLFNDIQKLENELKEIEVKKHVISESNSLAKDIETMKYIRSLFEDVDGLMKDGSKQYLSLAEEAEKLKELFEKARLDNVKISKIEREIQSLLIEDGKYMPSVLPNAIDCSNGNNKDIREDYEKLMRKYNQCKNSYESYRSKMYQSIRSIEK